ncbi:type III secretion system chaperone family protein [Paenimyroides baculatum]|uniref:YbjN domain-containing protein n=1 Tax=Paenimyroides baculatum TaxID=2608000 RepID=A0A5M6CFA0_9FLAO|nr:YbjN domain-containing protein [Paenimyroides baculatum]KAA5533854.1 YbjN domain-containing protein [Paenimyroides baculatum]
MHFLNVEKYILDTGYSIKYKSKEEGIFLIENLADGVQNLIVGVAAPVLIFEQYLFTLQADSMQVFKGLLMKNRDIIHGAFALTEDGSKVIFRYTLQIHNLDFNEFDAALNSLSLLLSEYSEQLIQFSKN